MPATGSSDLVTFRDGFVADWPVVQRLLDLEGRGCRFQLEDGGRFRVIPSDLLTRDDVAFLLRRRNEARAVLDYCERLAQVLM
jgi:hypothetical protein